MNILGLNAFHPDAAAALLLNGDLIALLSEEELTGRKERAGFPALAARTVLSGARITPGDLDRIAIATRPSAKLRMHWRSSFDQRVPRIRLAGALLRRGRQALTAKHSLADALGVERRRLRARFHFVEHHIAHIASTFLPSPFEEAACLTLGGFGDLVSMVRGLGRDRDLEILDRRLFPHSLGTFWAAVTQLIGVDSGPAERELAGLVARGRPRFVEEMRRLIRPASRGMFELDLSYFQHLDRCLEWGEGSDERSADAFPIFAPGARELLAVPASRDDSPPSGRWRADIAHSAQVVYEEVLFHVLADLQRRTGVDKLTLAGGGAQNPIANAKIAEHTKFRRVIVQPARGESGAALGAALYVEHVVLKRPRRVHGSGAHLSASPAAPAAGSANFERWNGERDVALH